MSSSFASSPFLCSPLPLPLPPQLQLQPPPQPPNSQPLHKLMQHTPSLFSRRALRGEAKQYVIGKSEDGGGGGRACVSLSRSSSSVCETDDEEQNKWDLADIRCNGRYDRTRPPPPEPPSRSFGRGGAAFPNRCSKKKKTCRCLISI